MGDNQELYNQRLTRIKKAIALEKPDRTPIYLWSPYFLKYGEPTAKMSDFINRPEWADDMVLKAYEKLEAIDAGGPGVVGNVQANGYVFLAKIKLPGRELPEDMIWQVDEVGLLTEEDYDTILNIGWKKFLPDFLMSRLGYTREEIEPDPELMKKQDEKFRKAGIVKISGVMTGAPFDALCTGRGTVQFMKDLFRMPDKVKAVMDVILEEMVEDEIKQIRAEKPLCTFVAPCVRANCDFLSRKMFEKFGWPLFKKLTDVAIAEGSDVFFHMDARWDDFLDYFTDFPKGRCIFDPDGLTDIYKIKEVLGDRMCITADVSPAMLTLGTPDEVYNYCRKLITDMGPAGFMLSSACCMPYNSKPENLEALVAAALG